MRPLGWLIRQDVEVHVCAAVLGKDVGLVHAGVSISGVLFACHIEVVTEEKSVEGKDGEVGGHGVLVLWGLAPPGY